MLSRTCAIASPTSVPTDRIVAGLPDVISACTASGAVPTPTAVPLVAVPTTSRHEENVPRPARSETTFTSGQTT
jgi:hypothetical protein